LRINVSILCNTKSIEQLYESIVCCYRTTTYYSSIVWIVLHWLSVSNDPHHSFKTIVARGYSSHGIGIQITRNTHYANLHTSCYRGQHKLSCRHQVCRLRYVYVSYIIQSIGMWCDYGFDNRYRQ